MTLSALASHINENKDDLYQALRSIATASACKREIASTSNLLLKAEQQLSNIFANGHICSPLYVFLPGNMVLYSLALYAIIPSMVACAVKIKASGQSELIVKEIFKILNDYLPNNIIFWEHHRDSFRKEALTQSCVFCGSYSMACRLARLAGKDYPFIYLGSGINPFLVTSSANLETAVRCAVEERVFNGGRDCLCPDIFLIHESVASSFVESLRRTIETLPVGLLNCDDTVVCPMDNSAAIHRTRSFLSQYNNFIICGGNFNEKLSILEPTILVRPFSMDFSALEFFGPLWNILIYKSDLELSTILQDSHMIAKTQGITVFGYEDVPGLELYTMIGRNCGLQDVEDGNLAFGGWGGHVSFIVHRGKRHNRPVLVPQELVWATNSYCGPSNYISHLRESNISL